MGIKEDIQMLKEVFDDIIPTVLFCLVLITVAGVLIVFCALTWVWSVYLLTNFLPVDMCVCN